jgi:hypothetical protein
VQTCINYFMQYDKTSFSSTPITPTLLYAHLVSHYWKLDILHPKHCVQAITVLLVEVLQRLWSGEICCFFSFLLYHLRISHVAHAVPGQLQNTLWKNNCKELGTQKFIKNQKKIIIPAKFDLLHFQVSMQFDNSMESIKSQCGPSDFGHLFDNLQRGYSMVRESMLWSWVIVAEFGHLFDKLERGIW